MTALQVIKVGGSLLAETGSMQPVAAWLEHDRRPGETRLLLAGGGEVVEQLRRIDAANPLPTAATHRAAILVMDVHSRLLADWLPDIQVLDFAASGSPAGLLSPPPGDYAILVDRWLAETEPSLPGERLTTGWQTTSDAIAGRLAACLDAPLTLLKHSLETTYSDIHEAAAAGTIDAELPRVADRRQPIRLVALGRSRMLAPFSDFPTESLDWPAEADSTA